MKFNANNAPQLGERDNSPIPDGTYRVEVITANELDNKMGTGKYIELALEIVGPSHVGRRLWARYTTSHSTSDKAVEIGLGQLGEASRALGHPVFDHESELAGCIGECKVGRQRNDPERNEIKGWIVPAASKGQPVYSRQRQAQGAEQHDIHRNGGQLRQAAANMPPAAPHPADDFDNDPPF